MKVTVLDQQHRYREPFALHVRDETITVTRKPDAKFDTDMTVSFQWTDGQRWSLCYRLPSAFLKPYRTEFICCGSAVVAVRKVLHFRWYTSRYDCDPESYPRPIFVKACYRIQDEDGRRVAIVRRKRRGATVIVPGRRWKQLPPLVVAMLLIELGACE